MSKARVTEELEYLRQQGLAQSGRGKFKASGMFLICFQSERNHVYLLWVVWSIHFHLFLSLEYYAFHVI